jgi:hypothetical protein
VEKSIKAGEMGHWVLNELKRKRRFGIGLKVSGSPDSLGVSVENWGKK